MVTLAHETISHEDIIELCDWLQTNPKLTKGDVTIEFEDAFAGYVDAKYAVYVNSGSSANLMALYALVLQGLEDDKPIKKVGVPALSWATDYSPIVQLGLEPVMIDCDSVHYGIKFSDLSSVINDIDALINVSVLGFCGDVSAIEKLVQHKNIPMIQDNCESFGSKTADGTNISKFGNMATWSLYYGHHISTIEGGMITTDCVETYNLLLMLRSHGWTRDLGITEQSRYKQTWNIDDFSAKYRFFVPGFNFRNTEIGAFLGLKQLEKADYVVRQRYENYLAYYDLLKNIKLPNPSLEYISNFAIPIVTKNKAKLVTKLARHNIECRPLIAGSMTKQPMCKTYSPDMRKCPNAEVVDEFGLYVPNHAGLKYSDIREICEIINGVINEIR